MAWLASNEWFYILKELLKEKRKQKKNYNKNIKNAGQRSYVTQKAKILYMALYIKILPILALHIIGNQKNSNYYIEGFYVSNVQWILQGFLWWQCIQKKKKEVKGAVMNMGR